MGRALPFLIVLVATLVALIDCLSTDRDDVRGLPKVVWCLVILLLPVVGVIAWFFAGRPLATEHAGIASAGGSRRRSAKPVAPDDDPEFLRNIDTTQSRRDAELLRRWEEDLKRREEE